MELILVQGDTKSYLRHDCLPSHPTSKDETATDSCFTFIVAHQGGTLMVDAK